MVSRPPDLPAVCFNEGLIGLASWIRGLENEPGLCGTPDSSSDEGDGPGRETTAEPYSPGLYGRYEGLGCVRVCIIQSPVQ